jgi:hypothetical protein
MASNKLDVKTKIPGKVSIVVIGPDAPEDESDCKRDWYDLGSELFKTLPDATLAGLVRYLIMFHKESREEAVTVMGEQFGWEVHQNPPKGVILDCVVVKDGKFLRFSTHSYTWVTSYDDADRFTAEAAMEHASCLAAEAVQNYRSKEYPAACEVGIADYTVRL